MLNINVLVMTISFEPCSILGYCHYLEMDTYSTTPFLISNMGPMVHAPTHLYMHL